MMTTDEMIALHNESIVEHGELNGQAANWLIAELCRAREALRKLASLNPDRFIYSGTVVMLARGGLGQEKP